jgi:two-component system chemotaxis response regulator CheB
LDARPDKLCSRRDKGLIERPGRYVNTLSMIRTKTKILVIDDSAVVREFMRGIINKQRDMEVVATASDPYVARDKFIKLKPDVLTLDIQMPRMDGLTFLKKLMAAHPTPVLMISSHTQKGSQAALQALRLGAVDFVGKPSHPTPESLAELEHEIVEKVRAAAGAKVKKKLRDPSSLKVPAKYEVDQVVELTKTPPRPGGPMVVLIGASTGGTIALEQVLTRIPKDAPPIAVVQHMPQHFTKTFADRLNELSELEVREAADLSPLLPGQVAIAPGGKHMLLEKGGPHYRVRVKDGPPVNRHKPSVDVLFRSGVNSAGPNAVAVILTGMGNDGAKAMNELHQAGAFTVGQNEATCTVYGMPKAAAALGAVDRVVPLENIAPLLIGLWRDSKRI